MPERVYELDRNECLERLQRGAFLGRLAYVADGRPQIVPINYVADSESVTFCTAEGTKLNALAQGAPVAFEIDDSRPLYHAGWSVVVTGTAQEVTDPDHLARLRSGPLKSWAVSPMAHWIRITIEGISGRAIDEE